MSEAAKTQCGRRKYLALLGATLSTSVAGCSGTLEGDVIRNDVTYPPKVVSEGNWVSSSKSVQKLDQTGLSGYGATRLYRNTEVQQAMKERFAGQFTKPLTLGFASHLQYKGLASSGVTADRIYDEVKPEFTKELRDEGLKNIGEVPEDIWKNDQREDPNTKILKGEKFGEFTASYTVPEDSPRINLSHYGPQTFLFSEETVQLRGLLFVRDYTLAGTDGEALVVGGVYPSGNYTESSTVTLAENGSSSLNLTVSLDSGLSASSLRSALVDEFISPMLEEVENAN